MCGSVKRASAATVVSARPEGLPRGRLARSAIDAMPPVRASSPQPPSAASIQIALAAGEQSASAWHVCAPLPICRIWRSTSIVSVAPAEVHVRGFDDQQRRGAVVEEEVVAASPSSTDTFRSAARLALAPRAPAQQALQEIGRRLQIDDEVRHRHVARDEVEESLIDVRARCRRGWCRRRCDRVRRGSRRSSSPRTDRPGAGALELPMARERKKSCAWNAAPPRHRRSPPERIGAPIEHDGRHRAAPPVFLARVPSPGGLRWPGIGIPRAGTVLIE